MQTDALVDIDLEAYDPSGLSPRSKGVYNQWQMDKTDELLVDGYFRECDITQSLSTDIALTIAAYYTKAKTKKSLKRKLEKLAQLRRIKILKRKRIMKALPCISLVVIIVLFFLFGSDIAALVITNKYDCDAVLNTGINDFLFRGSVSHIACLGTLCVFYTVCVRFADDSGCTWMSFQLCIIVVSLWLIPYSIIGSILYSKTVIYHPCSNVLISWIVLKFVLYVLVVPVVVVRDLETNGNYNFILVVYTVFAGLLAFVGVVFGTDIAGLTVLRDNDCDLAIDGGSTFVMFGVNTFLFYGCVIHIVIEVMKGTFFVVVVLNFPHTCVIRTSVVYSCVGVSYAFWLLSWGIIGCLLYSEMNERNKPCADATISWAVVKIVECLWWQCFTMRWMAVPILEAV
eukprot:194206_1